MSFDKASNKSGRLGPRDSEKNADSLPEFPVHNDFFRLEMFTRIETYMYLPSVVFLHSSLSHVLKKNKIKFLLKFVFLLDRLL